ncbi:hypothetical protein DMR_41830 [Solidesulfovibrio magneticus RS-1]|uniref:Uncharacterized protein n=1 Tax=Solidesulfovibrio magneticus (strain ATCC 700980 / DSM 13731 / RS-1) TaxID=573370 RepID=C4XPX4_SOLM1|nr:hypothetical protein DMR_41830 [Solidesulfovibrio magneticus RS-1]
MRNQILSSRLDNGICSIFCLQKIKCSKPDCFFVDQCSSWIYSVIINNNEKQTDRN